MALWIVGYTALLVWSLSKGGRFVGGGVALVALSFVPMIFGGWTTASEWHDSPLMGLYYLPTVFAAILASIVAAVGPANKMRQALRTRNKA